MAVLRRQVLGEVVTGYEVNVNGGNSEQRPAELNDETVRYLYERLMDESDRLASSSQSES
jgi:hypothetical protein